MTQFPLSREHSLALKELGFLNNIFILVTLLILHASIDSVMIKNTQLNTNLMYNLKLKKCISFVRSSL